VLLSCIGLGCESEEFYLIVTSEGDDFWTGEDVRDREIEDSVDKWVTRRCEARVSMSDAGLANEKSSEHDFPVIEMNGWRRSMRLVLILRRIVCC